MGLSIVDGSTPDMLLWENDCSDVSSSYSNFSADGPDISKRCTAIDPAGLWRTHLCDERMQFVCQEDIG